jgi:hypothetical protein
VLQQRWTNTYGPGATGQYAGRSYWLATENWSGQNYPKDTAVYNKMGGFANGYVPLFIIIGKDNKVFWDDNSSSWENALKSAIDEMPGEGVYVNSSFADISMVYSQTESFDVSGVFRNLNGDPVTVQFESNTNPEIATVSVSENIMSITANGSIYGNTTVKIRGTSGDYSATDEFILTVFDPANINIEDFETGDFSSLPWLFSGNMGWQIDNSNVFEGIYSAKSETITHNQKAEMSFEVEYPTKGRIIYNARTSSESNYDFLRFYIDGVEKKRLSGSTSWQETVFTVEAGTHTFKWAYTKDGSSSSGSDCAWLDFITIEGGTLTGIENNIVPSETVLHQNYPNPFNPETIISFTLSQSTHAKLSIFNHKGEKGATLFEGKLQNGLHSYNFKADGLTAGVYFYRLETDGSQITKKMILLK